MVSLWPSAEPHHAQLPEEEGQCLPASPRPGPACCFLLPRAWSWPLPGTSLWCARAAPSCFQSPGSPWAALPSRAFGDTQPGEGCLWAQVLHLPPPEPWALALPQEPSQLRLLHCTACAMPSSSPLHPQGHTGRLCELMKGKREGGGKEPGEMKTAARLQLLPAAFSPSGLALHHPGTWTPCTQDALPRGL